MNKSSWKNLLILFSLCSLVIVIIFVFLINSSTKTLSRSIEDDILNETGRAANQISATLENSEGTVDTLAALVFSTFNRYEHLDSLSATRDYLDMLAPTFKNSLFDIEDAAGLFFTLDIDLVNQEEAYEIWYVYDKEGNVVPLDASANGIYSEAFTHYDADYMQFYFQAIENNGEGVWVGPGYDPDIDADVLTYSKAVSVDNLFVGVVGVDIHTDQTTDLIKATNLKYDGDTFLLNQEGGIVNASNFSKAKKKDYQMLLKENMPTFLEKKYGVFHANIDGKENLISFYRLSNDWTIVLSNQLDTIYSPIKLMRATFWVLCILLIFFLTGLLYYLLKKYNTPLQAALDLLRKMDINAEISEEEKENLENEEEIIKLLRRNFELQKTKDIMIAHKSRLSQAGEMMSSIAHQWKQPLNNTNIILHNIKDDYINAEMTRESLFTQLNRVEHLIRYMSESIDDYNTYIKPDNGPTNFSINKAIDAALNLMADSLKKIKIAVSFYAPSEFFIVGYRNSFYHVILNIISNAIDAIDDNSEELGQIKISLASSDAHYILSIFNNGVPLTDENIENLFMIYHTTKGDKGTGLGLSISKNIIEKNMKGTITLKNVPGGVECKIILPKEGVIND